MQIACLGWGSLIWDPQKLPLSPKQPPRWHRDGPTLPIEFARKSSRDRLTLVVLPQGSEGAVQVLWALLDCSNWETARDELAFREFRRDPPPSRAWKEKNIGLWTKGAGGIAVPHREQIGQWAIQKGLDVVVWTALGANFGPDGAERVPTKAEALGYLRDVKTKGISAAAEEYVRRTPVEINTSFRKDIETAFGWPYDGSKTGVEICP